jgi:transcriptional regulator with XRE-family HTH domain
MEQAKPGRIRASEHARGTSMNSQPAPTNNTTRPGRSAGMSSDYSIDTEETVRRVGGRIRALRAKRRLTLQDMAEQTGVSVSMLSMLERGVASPSIGTLVAVASALGIHVSELFEEVAPQQKNPVNARADQIVVETAEGVTRRLVHMDVDRGLEVVVNEYEPSTASAGEPLHHEGAECGLVLSGTLTVELGQDTYTLRSGDAISYSSATPHRLINNGRTRLRTVWFNLS